MPDGDRYFVNVQSNDRKTQFRRELIDSLERINTFNPPVQTCSTGWTFHGFYAGPTSIALLFYRLHLIYPTMHFKCQSFEDWAQAYLDLSSHLRTPDPDPNHCGIANETLAHCALRAVLHKDASLVTKLCSYQHVINSAAEVGSNEWLYGRAGYLYFLRFASSVFDASNHLSASQLLARTIQQTINRIMASPLPWTWHGKEYLGAAHGYIGIICQIVLSDPVRAASLQQLMKYVLSQQFPTTGNFPSSIPAGSDRLVQFCHGAPGFVVSLRSVQPHFPEQQDTIEQAVRAAQQDVKTRGLLTKKPCLCHGIASNALALVEREDFDHFLSFTTTQKLEEQKEWLQDAGKTDDLASLFTGEAGRAWLWAIADNNLPWTCIGYNDL